MAAAGCWCKLALIGFSCSGVAWAVDWQAPVEPCTAAFQWATATALTLSADGVPTHMDDEDGSCATMLSAIVKSINAVADSIPRTTAFVECFAGIAGTTRAIRSQEHRSYSFERKDYDWQDMCTLSGCLYCAWMLASICIGGTAWFSPQCSTWIGLAMGHSRRTRANPMGTDARLDCREANWISEILHPGFQTNQSAITLPV